MDIHIRRIMMTKTILSIAVLLLLAASASAEIKSIEIKIFGMD